MSYGLEKYTLPKLKLIGAQLGLRSRRSKESMIADISATFREYEEYKRDKIDKYEKIKQLGNRGKEGTTYLVKDTSSGNLYAMKTFRKTKSSNTLKKEYKLQKIAGKEGISPRVYNYDTVSKYIVMDVMDSHLLDFMNKHNGVLYKYQQQRIIQIFKTLDKIGIFHGDANMVNYMLKDRVVYIIDYGFAKQIDKKLEKSLKTKTPNMDIMLVGFILKMKEMNCPPQSYSYLIKHVSPDNINKYQL